MNGEKVLNRQTFIPKTETSSALVLQASTQACF